MCLRSATGERRSCSLLKEPRLDSAAALHYAELVTQLAQLSARTPPFAQRLSDEVRRSSVRIARVFCSSWRSRHRPRTGPTGVARGAMAPVTRRTFRPSGMARRARISRGRSSSRAAAIARRCVDDRIFVTVCVEASSERVLLCLDRLTGKKLWQTTVLSTPLEKKHHLNSFSSSTPPPMAKWST